MGVVSMAGIAYAAGPSGPIATDTASVASTTASRTVVDDRGHDRDGADDPVPHDVTRTSPARVVTIPGPSAARASDDPAGHAAADDHGASASYTGHEFGWNARHDSDHDHGSDG